VALAELLTARTARPPLAVGLFGDWGEGKSHFLGLLQQQVQATARPDNLLAHSAVRQVWFNAWHYAETDLWASLVAELFAQLAAPPDGDLAAEYRRQSRLAGELVAERGLRERLRAARARRDKLEQALREPVGPWESLTPEQQAQLGVLAGGDPAQAYRKAAQTVAALRETGRQSWRLIRGVPLGIIALFIGLIAGSLAIGAGIAWGLPAVSRLALALPGIGTILATAGLVARFMGAARARASAVWQAAQRLGEQQRQRLQTAAEVAAAEVAGLERQMQDLTAAGQLAGLVADRVTGASYRSRLGVMTQIREDFKHMAALLASAADDPQPNPATRSAPAGPESGADGAAPVGREARRDGKSWTTAEIDAAGDELPRIDRIILYIDDLDRCPPRRVVELLEAVHLLLAVDLFVVVVAVDPRWLLRSIAAHYRDLFDATTPPEALRGDLGGEPGEVLRAPAGEPVGMVDPDDEELWRSTPAQYLEKIFQVVLTLPPLDTGGYQQLLRTLVGTRDDQPTPPPDPPPIPLPAGTTTLTASTRPTATSAAETIPATTNHDNSRNGTTGDANGRDDGATEQAEQAGLFGVELPAARVVERVDPLTLEPDELALLDLLGPPLLVLTPRGVKRLANSYGLLTALRRDHREADLAEQHAPILDPASGNLRQVAYRPYRAGMVLLAALVAYPALGPALFGHLNHTAAAHPHQSWTQFLETLQPQQTHGRWANPADPQMTPVQAQQWHALLGALHHVAQTTAARDLALPESLAAWAQWVVPVGRLSFPTGRIISTLDRQHPFPTRPSDTTP
jgi:hypothetical protein